MHRLIPLLSISMLVAAGCGPADGGPADPASEDQFYILYLDRVLELGEKWWGYPPLTDYCVAITPGSMEPSLDQSRDPSEAVLDGLGAANPSKAFHPYSTCRERFPFKAPTGEVAGLLWVAPLESTDRTTLSGGWTALRDLTGWRCTFVETEGAVDLQECRLGWET